MKYTHKGIDIGLLEGSGEFHARIEGKEIVKPSLAAMKKVIDGGVKDKAAYNPPLVMLSMHPAAGRKHDGPPIHEFPREAFRVTVERLSVNRRSYRTTYNFVTKEIGERQDLIADTDENYEKLIAYWKIAHDAAKSQEEWNRKSEQARQAIPLTSARDCAAEKGVS